MEIRFHGVSKKYQRQKDNVWALKQCSFSLASGSTTLITGANGSGKSTLLSLAGGIIRPTSGRIYCDEVETSGQSEPFRSRFRQCNFGYHFQGEHLLSGLSIAENLTLAALPRLVSLQANRQKIEQLLEQLRVGADADTRVEQLSGGQQQKVSLARALINDPPVILADEPTNHLDEASAAEIRELLCTLPGKTVVIVSHDPVFATEFFFDQRLFLDDGKVQFAEGAS
ncbi:MAG: ABC transporter ATP-binding protein [Deltaproteobacteria bacterium]|nr:MAG: ABC transporter ATP-binding protein [Deltaproteobacteria bacterium]